MRETVHDAGSAPIVNLCTVGSGATPSTPTVSWSLYSGTGGAATNSNITAAWTPTGKAYRVAWTTAPTASSQGDAGFAITGALIPGQTYYAAVTVACSKATTLTPLVGNWNITGGAIGTGTGTTVATSGTANVNAGQPTTFWMSFTPGANTTGCKVYVSAAAGATWAVGDTLDASCGVLIATTSTARSGLPFGGYFDGSGIGPVTQPAWAGAVNASASVAYPLRADAVVNRFPNPACVNVAPVNAFSFWSSGGTWTQTLTYSSTPGPGGPPTNTYLRAAITGFTATTGSIWYRVAWRVGSSGAAGMPVSPGEKVTVSVWVRLNTTNSDVRMYAADYNAQTWVAESFVSYPITANTWTRISHTHTVGASGVSALGAYVQVTNGAAGDVLDVTGWMVTAGTVLQPYADGSVPGWTWDGPPGASTSHGPPYTVAALNTGGQRDDTASAAGTALSPAAFDPVAQGVTLVSVIDVPAILPNGNTATIAVYGTPNDTPANSQVSHRLLGNPGAAMAQARRTGGAGPQVQLATAPGRYVLASGIRPGGYLTVAAPGRPVTAESTANMTATNGWYQVFGNDAYHTLVRTLLVAGWDDNNMWRLMGWLARQTGVTPPLEEIAGSPLAVNTTPGTSVAFTPPAATAGRTMYVAFQTTAPATTGTLPYASFGNVAIPNSNGGTDQLAFRHGGVNYVEARYQSHTATAAAMGGMPAETVGVHVGAVWMIDGDLGYGAAMDGTDSTANPATQAASGGLQGSPHYLNVAAAHAAGNALAAYVFTGTHDRATRLRITAWLARQYGATAPTGY